MRHSSRPLGKPPRWQTLEEAEIAGAWGERERIRALAGLLMTSSVLFGCLGPDSEQVNYVAGRGDRCRPHSGPGYMVRECRNALLQAGMDERQFGPVIVITPVEHVTAWVARDTGPDLI